MYVNSISQQKQKGENSPGNVFNGQNGQKKFTFLFLHEFNSTLEGEEVGGRATGMSAQQAVLRGERRDDVESSS